MYSKKIAISIAFSFYLILVFLGKLNAQEVYTEFRIENCASTSLDLGGLLKPGKVIAKSMKCDYENRRNAVTITYDIKSWGVNTGTILSYDLDCRVEANVSVSYDSIKNILNKKIFSGSYTGVGAIGTAQLLDLISHDKMIRCFENDVASGFAASYSVISNLKIKLD
jgi:hypothetical protein